MNVSVALKPWLRWALYLLPLAAVLVCALWLPWLCVPLSLLSPLLLCPLAVVAPWLALALGCFPAAVLAASGWDRLFAALALLWPCAALLLTAPKAVRAAPFRRTVTALTVAALMGFTLLCARATALMPGDLFGGLADALAGRVTASADCDGLLVRLVNGGLLAWPDTFHDLSLIRINDFVLMSPALRTELINILRLQLRTWLATAIPAIMAHGSVLLGLFTAMLTCWARHRRDPNAPSAPRFSTLRLSRRERGDMLVVCLFSLAMSLVDGSVPAIAATLSNALFSAVFQLMGAATLLFLLMQKHPRRAALYAAIVTAMYLFVPMALILTGLFDQIMNLRAVAKYHQEGD